MFALGFLVGVLVMCGVDYAIWRYVLPRLDVKP